jgi:acyl carrier protein
VKNRSLDQALLLSELKYFVADLFRADILAPESIEDDAPLTGGAFDLDSFDLLELSICIEEGFGIAIRGEGASRDAFCSIASLADFIRAQTWSGQERRLPVAERLVGGEAGRIPAGFISRRAIA